MFVLTVMWSPGFKGPYLLVQLQRLKLRNQGLWKAILIKKCFKVIFS